MPLRTADWLVVAAAAALVGALAVAAWSPAGAALAVAIQGPGGVQTVPLTADQRIEVEGLAGISVVDVRDGRVRFSAGPCRNRVCVAAGWLSAAGAFAVCVPNGVSVQLLGDEAAVDAINY